MTNDAQDFLAAMAKTSEQRVTEAKFHVSERDMRQRALTTPAAPELVLDKSGFDVIAELKLKSPVAGDLGDETNGIAERVAHYARAGAAAVSVLTEPSRFGGKLEHLATAAQALREYNIPTMRKDFVVHDYQVFEARASGAGGVLIIARMLGEDSMQTLLAVALGLGMFVLLEAFDAGDLESIRRVTRDIPRGGQILIGLNTRDLKTLSVKWDRLHRLYADFPADFPRVAESGVTAPDKARQAAEWGYDLVLVGTALMRTKNPGKLVTDMLEAGRGAA